MLYINDIGCENSKKQYLKMGKREDPKRKLQKFIIENIITAFSVNIFHPKLS